jgi:hypothetical protein
MKKFIFLLFFIPIILKSSASEVPEFDFVKILDYDIFPDRGSVWEVGFYDLKSMYLLVPNYDITEPTQTDFTNGSNFIIPTLLGKDGSLIKMTNTRKTGTYYDTLQDIRHEFSYALIDDNKIRFICKRGFRYSSISFAFFSHPVFFDFNYNLELQKVKTDTTRFQPYNGTYLVIQNGRNFFGYSDIKILKDSLGYITKHWGVFYIKEYKETEDYLEDLHNDIELKFPTNLEDTLMSEFKFRFIKYPEDSQISGYFIFKDSTGLYERLCNFDSQGKFISYNKEKLPRVFIGGSVYDKNGNAYTFNLNLDKPDSIPPTLVKYDPKGNLIWEKTIPQDIYENDSLKIYIYRNNINAKMLDSNHIIVYHSKYYYDSLKTRILFPFFYIYDLDGNLLKTYEWDLKINGDVRWWYIQDIYKEDDDHLFIIGRPTSNMEIDSRIIISRIKFSPTSVKDKNINKISMLEVYPNPSNDIININIKVGILNYKILDVLGQVVQAGKTQGQIEINKLIPGIYNLEISDDKSKYFAKFIKN